MLITTTFILINFEESDMYDKLNAAGLTGTEAKIYVTLVDIGRGQAGLISRRSGIHRRSVYDALERLIKKGLVSYIRENEKRVYVASDPKRLLDIAEQLRKDISDALPVLEAKYNDVKTRQETSFFHGVDGVRSIFEDQLNSSKDIFVIATANLATQGLKYYLPHYTDRRVKKKIKLHILYSKGVKGEKIPLAEIRHLPDEFASPISTNIYADRVAILIWSLDPVAILIKNKQVAEAYKKYFDVLWAFAKTAKK